MQVEIVCTTLPTMHMRLRAVLTVVSALMLSACKSKPLVVEVPAAFSGDVEINCGSSSANALSITVDFTGRVDGAVCPQHKVDLRIMRDGKSVEPTGNVVWETSGDGILVGIRFHVP